MENKLKSIENINYCHFFLHFSVLLIYNGQISLLKIHGFCAFSIRHNILSWSKKRDVLTLEVVLILGEVRYLFMASF